MFSFTRISIRSSLIAAAGLLGMSTSAATAAPLLLTFQEINGEMTGNAGTLSSQLGLVIDDGTHSFTDVDDLFMNGSADTSATTARFTFFNAIGLESSIMQVYFEDGFLFGTSAIPTSFEQSSGVDYAAGANPGHPPGGSPSEWNATGFYEAQPDGPGNGSGTPAQGIDQVGEWLSIAFAIIDGQTLQDVFNALAYSEDNAVNLRIAMHVQSIGTEGDSLTFVNNSPPSGGPGGGPEPVPEPGTLALMALGAVGLGGYARRRRMKA